MIKNLRTTGRPFTSQADLDKKRKAYVDSLDPKSKKTYSSTYTQLSTVKAKEQAKKDFSKANKPSIAERAGSYFKTLKENQGEQRNIRSRLQETENRQVGAFSPMQQSGGDRARAALFGSDLNNGGQRIRDRMYEGKDKSETNGDRVRKLWGL